VLGARGIGHATVVATHVKSGFETAIAVPGGYTSFQVEALDRAGHRLGVSPSFAPGS
jgi:hypothetical protein